MPTARTGVRQRVEVAADEHRRLLRLNALARGDLREQLVQLVREHHALDELHVAELRVPVDVGGADDERRADDALAGIQVQAVAF